MPDWRAGNPYQDLLANSIKSAGTDVSFENFPRGIFSLNRLKTIKSPTQIIHIHWINDLIEHILWPQSRFQRYIKLLLLYLDIIFLRLRGIPVVWTVHNVVAHESINIPFEIMSRQIIARACSHIFVHSKSALDKIKIEYNYASLRKASVYPHGNYDGIYPMNEHLSDEFVRKHHLSDKDICIMFFGAVRRYKGVLDLIEAFSACSRNDLRLIIAGKSNNPELSRALEISAKNDSRITLIQEFIADEMVAPIFKSVDAAVIPFEKTLTSGSTVLAMTMSKATLLPSNAKVFDLADDKSSLFFDTTQELTDIFKNLEKSDLTNRSIPPRVRIVVAPIESTNRGR